MEMYEKILDSIGSMKKYEKLLEGMGKYDNVWEGMEII